MLFFCVPFSNQGQFHKSFKENPSQEGKLHTSVAAHESRETRGNRAI